MPDVVDPGTRSRMMSAIRATGTGPEMQVRRFLHSRGFRYRLHDRRLPGRPDIVLPRWHSVVEVRGCFWHAHEGCTLFRLPGTRRSFWKSKLMGNRERDERNQLALASQGWRVAIVWECSLREDGKRALDRLERWLRSGRQQLLELSG